MPDLDIVIRNGTVVTAAEAVQCDIGIREGRIAVLGTDLGRASRTIDADGLLVLPGGVDSHCHLDQPQLDGSRMSDDFLSGTTSAAFGGTTTVLPFAVQFRGQSLRAAVDAYHAQAEGKAVIDYGFHMIITDPNSQVLGQEIPGLVRSGYTSFKVFMTYEALKLNDREMLEVLASARREGAMTMIHAENADCIDWLTEKLLAAGKHAPRYHALSRPPAVEREAAHRAITLAEIVDVPIMIVHVSGADAIEPIRAAQARGLCVYAETCPQYLVLTAADLDLEGFEGSKYVCSPPPRDEASQRAVWAGITSGAFQTFSSDHCPFRYQGGDGKAVRGRDVPYTYVPNGIPGIETRLPILFSEGVAKGRIPLTKFVELTATGPARLYGLAPRKGVIAVGADADIALWDPQKEVTITNDLLHHDCDYTPYEGLTVRGWPVTVLSRGEVVVSEGSMSAEAGRGAFLPRARPDSARPLGGDLHWTSRPD